MTLYLPFVSALLFLAIATLQDIYQIGHVDRPGFFLANPLGSLFSTKIYWITCDGFFQSWVCPVIQKVSVWI